MTTKALFPLLEKLARCRRDTDVSGVAMDAAKGMFGCHLAATLFLDPSLAVTERALFGLHLDDIEEYERHWRHLDRIFLAVNTRAAPVHTWQVFTEDEALRDPVWLGYARGHGIYHYLSAPIFGSRGRLIGVLNLCRRPHDRHFDGTTIEMASALAGFLSATLARVSGAEVLVDDHSSCPLTPREMQVARLAAAGRNNVEIALTLGIARETVKQTLRRVYCKLDVSGRAKMAATMTARGWIRS